MICLHKRTRGLLSLVEFRFHGIDRGEFSVPVWLSPRSTCVQFTSFPDSRTASSTAHGQYLFRGELLGFHTYIIQRSTSEKCSILLIFGTFASSQGINFGSTTFFRFRAKLTSFAGLLKGKCLRV